MNEELKLTVEINHSQQNQRLFPFIFMEINDLFIHL